MCELLSISADGFFITDEMIENIVTQLFLFSCCMPNKTLKVNGLNLYSNKGDLPGKFTDMIVVDFDVFDSQKTDTYKHNFMQKFAKQYNANSCEAVKIMLEKKVQRNKTPKALHEIDKLNLLTRSFIKSGVKNSGVINITSGQKAAVTRLCNVVKRNPALAGKQGIKPRLKLNQTKNINENK